MKSLEEYNREYAEKYGDGKMYAEAHRKMLIMMDTQIGLTPDFVIERVKCRCGFMVHYSPAEMECRVDNSRNVKCPECGHRFIVRTHADDMLHEKQKRDRAEMLVNGWYTTEEGNTP